MGLFSRFTPPQSAASKPGSASLSGRHQSSRPMDYGGIDRPAPIGRPHEVPKRHHEWTPHRLDEFSKGIDNRYGHMHPEVADQVRARIKEGAGANHQYSPTEVNELAAGLERDRFKLGLTREQAEKITGDFLAGPKE